MKKAYNNRFNNGKPNPNAWSDEDKRYLKANYHLLEIEELAKHFSRTVQQVKDQAGRQYLTKRFK